LGVKPTTAALTRHQVMTVLHWLSDWC